jgi:integrase/recombinase XerC
MNAKKRPSQKQQLKDSEYTLTSRELKKLIGAAPNLRDRTLIKLLAVTGLRRFEIRDLDLRDIDFKNRILHIVGKGDKERDVPCPEEVLTDIRYLVGSRKTGTVFQSNRGGPFVLHHINRILAKTGKRAGLENPNPKYIVLNPHLLRHTFARLWKDKGYSIESLSKILGHTSVKTTLDEYGTEDLKRVQANYDEAMAEIF